MKFKNNKPKKKTNKDSIGNNQIGEKNQLKKKK
jgi:hypothetical protein